MPHRLFANSILLILLIFSLSFFPCFSFSAEGLNIPIQLHPPCELILNQNLAEYLAQRNQLHRGLKDGSCERASLYMHQKMPHFTVPIKKWEIKKSDLWPSMWVLKVVRPDPRPMWLEHLSHWTGFAINSRTLASALDLFHLRIPLEGISQESPRPQLRYMDWKGQFHLAPVGAEIVVHKEKSFALYRRQ